MSFSWGAAVGIGRRIGEESRRQEDVARQDQLRADDEDRAHYDSIAQMMEKVASDPSYLPESRAVAVKNFFKLKSEGRQNIKPKDREKMWTEVGTAAATARAKNTLGLSRKVSSAADTMNDSGVPYGDMIAQGMQSQSQQMADQTSTPEWQAANSSPYFTPEEHFANTVKMIQQASGVNGVGGAGGAESSGGGFGSGSGNPSLSFKIDKNGNPSFSSMPMSFQQKQSRFIDPRDNSVHVGNVWSDTKHGQAYWDDPDTGEKIPVRVVSNERSDVVVPRRQVVNGKPVITYQRRSSLEGQTDEQPVKNVSIVEPGADGNLHRRTYTPGYNGQPDKMLDDSIVGRNPMLDLQKANIAQGMALRGQNLLSGDQLDFMVNEENNGADMSKVPSPIYAAMLKRRGDLDASGASDAAQLPDRYNPSAQKSMQDSMRVINTTDRVSGYISSYLRDKNETPSKIPYKDALSVMAYGLGFSSADEFDKHLADLSILSLNSGASVGGKGIRNWQYIQKTLQHAPDPHKDSMQLIIDKLDAIKSLNEDMIAAARDTGLKSGVVKLPGQKQRSPIPKRQQQQKPESNNGDANQKFDQLFNSVMSQ